MYIVISAHWGPRWVNRLRTGIQDQPGQHGETPSLLKVSGVWWHTLVIPSTQEAKAGALLGGCSKQRPHHFTPAWATEPDSVSINKQINK